MTVPRPLYQNDPVHLEPNSSEGAGPPDRAFRSASSPIRNVFLHSFARSMRPLQRDRNEQPARGTIVKFFPPSVHPPVVSVRSPPCAVVAPH